MITLQNVLSKTILVRLILHDRYCVKNNSLSEMIFDNLPQRQSNEAPRKMPPRSMSTPYNYGHHSKHARNEQNLLNFTDNNDSIFDNYTPEEQVLLRELEATETSELNKKLVEILQNQMQLNREVEQNVVKFTETVQQAQELIPYLTEATKSYQEAQEIAANIDSIRQFQELDISNLTPQNSSLFE